MPVLVDAANVLHVTGVLPPHLAGVDLVGLAELVERSRYADRQVTLVCDGGPAGNSRTRRESPVAIVRTGARSADDVMVERIEASTDPRRLTVVTEDREVLTAARRRRCPTMRSTDFLAHLAVDADSPKGPGPGARKPQGSLDPSAVNEWMRTFGLDPREGGAP